MIEIKPETKIIPVSDIFYSIQGEGFNVGLPSIFVRFAGCNLRCPWCDSWWAVEKQIILAKYSNTKEDAKELFKYLLHKGAYYMTGKLNIIFTGGEPLLYQDFISKIVTSMYTVYSELKNSTAAIIPETINDVFNFINTITFEIETNGTILPDKLINSIIDRYENNYTNKLVFEISPKLIDNILPKKLYEVTVKNIIKLLQIEKETNVINFICKFVTDGSNKDIEEIEKFIEETNLPREKVYLMPKCGFDSSKDYAYVGRIVSNICMFKHWRFSPREHVVLFDKYRAI